VDVRLKEGAGASESLVAFVEDRGEGLKDVTDTGSYVEGLTATAVLLRSTPDSIATPCSVKT